MNQLNLLEKNKKINLLDLNRRKIRELFTILGECSYHADQVMKWMYHYCCDDFNEMTNLSKVLRSKLKEFTEIRAPEIIGEKLSSDGTIKWVVSVGSQSVETVFIPEDKRNTLCISSQIGCSIGCTFCSTAQQGFSRNLHVFEIVGQVWRAVKIIRSRGIVKKHPITNVVIMGMGEPLLNLKNVVSSIEIMLDDFGFGLSKRRVTLSTSGIVPALNRLGDMIDISLAVSLHAPNDEIRCKIIPINKKYDIKSVLSSANRYLEKTNVNRGKITIEYVMLDHVNDSVKDAYELANLLNRRYHKINLIPWNPFPYAPYSCSPSSRINRFYEILIQHGFTTIIRKNRGKDIDAACGQLRGNVINRKRSISLLHKTLK